MNLGEFYGITTDIAYYEEQRDSAEKALKELYDKLVPNCPHSEAVEINHNIRGWGVHRRCLICGITDTASEGGTPGDEYDYGFPGHPSTTFWKGAKVTTVTKEKWHRSSKDHGWVVENGRAENRFA